MHTQTKSRLSQILILSFLALFAILLVRGYFSYQTFKSLSYNQAQKEASLLIDYVESMRSVYQKNLLQSDIALTSNNIGLLPSHAITTISQEFLAKNSHGLNIKNVSLNPRNSKNLADIEESKAIHFFRQNPHATHYSNTYKEKNQQVLQYAKPLIVQEQCLACHGQKKDANKHIAQHYSQAYNYAVGDIIGIVSVKIPFDKITQSYKQSTLNDFILTAINFTVIALIILFVYRKALFQIRTTQNNAFDYATKDPLTGLRNRRYLATINEHDNHIRHANSTVVVAFLDIDYFKKINDTYGHDAGDVVLKSFGLKLRELAQDNDIACRYGGEEFLLISYDISLEEAIAKLEYIRQSIMQISVVYNDNIIEFTASIGLSIGTHTTKMELLITQADKALYHAKNSGRNCTKVYDTSLEKT